MSQAADLFVSYTAADRAWAEWIAWQLEADGYKVVIQAWDFSPGRDWAHEMDRATSTANRVVTVLSPDYLFSAHGEAEWRVFYAKDPTGEQGLLIPVRVREVEPPGLLSTKVYVDLVGRDAITARKALIAAVRTVRGKPPDEPEFPGDQGRPHGSEVAPPFPNRPVPFGGELGPLDALTTAMRADEIGALRAFAAEASALLRQAGYSEADINAFSISLRELVDNVAIHVRPEESVRLEMLHHDGDAPLWHEGFGLDVTDSGSGFDFNDAILRLEQELSERGVEHGLLRAYRLGSWLMQVSVEPHVMSWGRERAPEIMPTVFEADDVVPFIFSYRQQAVQVWRNVHTFTQFEQYLKRSEAFTDLIFDPLLRPARRYVGIEVIGEGWTGVLSWERVLDRLLSFARRNNRFDKEFVLFVDSGPSEHQRMRDYCHDAGIPMFEDESTLRNFRVAIVSKAEPRPRWRGRRK